MVLLQSIDFSITLLQAFIGLIVMVIIAVILLWNNIPQRLSRGWKDLSELQNKATGILEVDIQKLKKEAELREAAITDLVRELDIRREINRQDTLTITSLKSDVINLEDAISRLRKDIKQLEGEAKSL